jgi:glutaredoxin
VKEFLSRSGNPFTVRSTDDDPQAYDDLVALGYRTVPVTVIGDVIVRGFDAEALAKALAAGG